MRPLTLTLFGFSVLAIAVTAVVGSRLSREKDEAAFAPSVRILLRESAESDADHKSRFFKALSALAQQHGLVPGDYIPKEVTRGYAVRISAGREAYAVAVLRGRTRWKPGDDTQYLLLLDQQGRLLDQLSCTINGHLTAALRSSGNFRTEVPRGHERDGARLIIRYAPEDGGSPSGNWSHYIKHAGQTHSYSWTKGGWDRGLCRVGVQGGRFVVLFPPSQVGD
jgi:hypothetical protein